MTSDDPNDRASGNQTSGNQTGGHQVGNESPGNGDPSRNDRRTRVFGMVAAGAAMVVLAIVAWVAIDGITAGDGGGQAASSAGSGGSETKKTDQNDADQNEGPRGDGDRSDGDRGEGSGSEDGDGDGNTSDNQDPPGDQNGQPQELTEHLLSLQRREPGDPLAKGAVDAPVVLIMYEDFRCPYCAKFASDVEPELQRYVEAGQLRLEWRDYPIFGDQSLAMAKAARAASRQDKFWEFYEVAYSVGDSNGKPKFPEKRIRQVAKQAGITDMQRFDRDRKDPDVMEEISADATEGQQIGVSSTPAFLINTQPVLGAQPVEVFVSIIEEELEDS